MRDSIRRPSKGGTGHTSNRTDTGLQMDLRNVLLACTAMFIAGCGAMPTSPDLMVQNAKENKAYTDKDVFEVNRPLAQVESVFRKKADECLRAQVASRREMGNGIYRREIRVFIPKVVADKQRVRLTVQTTTIEGTTEVGPIPDDGWYVLVADAYPVDAKTTRVESYVQWPGWRSAFKAVKHWSNGTNMGCPDMTK